MKEEQQSPKRLTHLVLGGGGLSGLAYIGVLRFLYAENLVDGITHISGASIGAVFATLLALRISLNEIETFFAEMFADLSIVQYPPQCLLNVIEKYGLDDGQKLLTYMIKAVKQYCDPDITFVEFAKRFGRNLVISATNLETMQAAYFSVNTTPNVKVLEAVRASMALPLLITPVQINDAHYIDGGLADNLPVTPFLSEDSKHWLVIKIDRAGSNNQSSQASKSNMTPGLPYSNIAEYIFHIMKIMSVHYIQKNEFLVPDPNKLNLQECPLPLVKFKCNEGGMILDVSSQELEACATYGYQAMYNHFAKYQTYFFTSASSAVEVRSPS